MPRAIWNGHISFGLVQIPVSLHTAVGREDLSFTMLDGRDMARVGYERVNKDTGEEVPWEEVVKGYEVDKGEFVVLTDEDFAAANVEATQTIDIVRFVDRDAIDVVYYDKPYYLEPTKKGQKAYSLLRETLRSSGLVGVAKVVIRRRQHLAALMVRQDVLVLEILRYAYEVRGFDELELPPSSEKKLGISQAEKAMAKQLVEGMTGELDLSAYHDDYRDDLLAMIDRKVERGEVNVVAEPERPEQPERPAAPADLMTLLKESVSQQGSARRKTARDTTRRAARTARAAKKKKKAPARKKTKAGKSKKKR